MVNKKAETLRKEAEKHLNDELLPFWLNRIQDKENGGYITHFDKNGKDTGENEKSLIAQTRSLYTMSSAHRSGYGRYDSLNLARHGFNYLINRMWDEESGGFYWMTDRRGKVIQPDKILYGQSFALYSLSEYTLASRDYSGLTYAEELFDLIREKCYDPYRGGYYEMFDRNWALAEPGSKGGDRKTLDTHMHLMESFTNLYECSRKDSHRKALLEIIDVLTSKMLHPVHKTGIPQFNSRWEIVPQVKFDIVWGWDRFAEGGKKANAEDNTSFGHNAEFAWLLIHALKILKMDVEKYRELLEKIFEHTVEFGIDREYGGVFVEGSHEGEIYDMEKEFWQQAEVMIGMLDAYILLHDKKYLEAYENVHRFVFDKMIHHKMGEWYPLLTREGKPIWTHMGHSWKINYHTVRCMIQTIQRLLYIENM